MGLDIKKGNKTYEFSNSSVSKIIASKAVGKDILVRSHTNNTTAKAAGLVAGDLYHHNGALKIVYDA